jgi:hypothetical protein
LQVIKEYYQTYSPPITTPPIPSSPSSSSPPQQSQSHSQWQQHLPLYVFAAMTYRHSTASATTKDEVEIPIVIHPKNKHFAERLLPEILSFLQSSSSSSTTKTAFSSTLWSYIESVSQYTPPSTTSTSSSTSSPDTTSSTTSLKPDLIHPPQDEQPSEHPSQDVYRLQVFEGPSFSGAPFHHHGPAFNLLIQGDKLWELLPPGNSLLHYRI